MRLNPNLRARLAAEAKRQDRSESYIAARAIDAFLQVQQIERSRLTAALAKADRGQFIPADAVNDWRARCGAAQEGPPPQISPPAAACKTG
jgi:predicted transcriptional regulator